METLKFSGLWSLFCLLEYEELSMLSRMKLKNVRMFFKIMILKSKMGDFGNDGWCGMCLLNKVDPKMKIYFNGYIMHSVYYATFCS